MNIHWYRNRLKIPDLQAHVVPQHSQPKRTNVFATLNEVPEAVGQGLTRGDALRDLAGSIQSVSTTVGTRPCPIWLAPQRRRL